MRMYEEYIGVVRGCYPVLITRPKSWEEHLFKFRDELTFPSYQ